jgi:hypothetical protein
MDFTRGKQGTFGQLNFAHAQLRDRRRTRRLVSLADRIHQHPGGTLPEKLKSPADLKALYRLCDSPAVTHAAIMDAVRRHTLEKIAQTPGKVLIVHDVTELDYTSHKSLADQLGQIGDGRGKGYICHNSLAVVPGSRAAIGLTSQILHHRVEVPRNESQRAHRERESRESRLWLQGTEGLPGEARLVDVCDRGADSFEFLEHELRSGRSFVIRSTQNRAILAGHGRAHKKRLLHDWVRSRPAVGERTVTISGRDGKTPRTATLQVSFAAVQILAPQVHKGEHGKEPLPVWAVRAVEPHPPEGEDPAEWILLTREPVDSFQDAERVLEYYECRWVIEEFHKGQKTGCQIEDMQFTRVERLEPMIAVLSAVAVTLLNLRDASRRPDAKRTPATELFSADYVRVLSAWRWKRIREDVSIHDFFWALARLGGHQNRKRDHPPGWLILWRGWTTLQAMVDGADAMNKCGQT